MTLSRREGLADDSAGRSLSVREPFPPPRTLDDLGQPSLQREELLRVQGARVVFADYALLQQDFPQLRETALLGTRRALRDLDASRRQRAVQQVIDDWLLESAAVISVDQARQVAVNTPIPIAREAVTAFRPPRYGRAVVRPVDGVAGLPGTGLLDIKGIGVSPGRVPHHGDHGSGLAALSEALEEVAFQRLIDAIFRHAGADVHALPIYAVLDLGFDYSLEPEPRATFPAGALVRSAHRRWAGGRELPALGSPEHFALTEIEFLLRHYGVTSATNGTFRFEETASGLQLNFHGQLLTGAGQVVLHSLREAASDSPERILCLDGLNIQTAWPVEANPLRALLVDFGHYEVRSRFENPLLSLVSNRPLMWGGVARPNEPHFVQPLPELAIPEEEWGWLTLPPDEVAALGYPADYNPYSRLELLCIDLAQRFRRNELDGSGVLSEIEALVARATARWPEPDRFPLATPAPPPSLED